MVWIVHREPQRRAALLRLAGVEDALAGAPGDRLFDAASPPLIVLLGAAGDFEPELEFAHRFAPRLRTARWILVCDPMDEAETRRLFDTLPAEVLAYPPDALLLRRRVVEARHARRADRLSERRARDALAARFARWLGDLDLPELLRALDPQLARVPILVRGEPGTGRGLLARYVHAFGGMTGGAFVSVACRRLTRLEEIVAGIARAAAKPAARHGLTICLEEIHLLAPPLARELRGWIEITPPDGVPHTTWLRWMGTAGPASELEDDASGLATTLAGIALEIPPLRQRPHLVSSLALDAAEAWAQAQGQRPRRFSEEALEALREYPWPGNVRELEAVITRTLAADPSDPVLAGALRFAASPVSIAGEPTGSAAGALRPEAARSEPVAPPRRDEKNGRDGLVRPDADPERTDERPGPGRPTPVQNANSSQPGDDALARRFLAAIAHEIRNPLVPIRTLAGLLPQRFDDAEFRERFATQVGTDVDRIASVLDRMSGFATLGPAQPRPVDVASLLDEVLDAHRDDIQARRLLVLKEIDRGQPLVRVDLEHLRFALAALVGKALSLMPERGDLYLASKHHPALGRSPASIRILLRYHTPRRIGADPSFAGVSLAENALELVMAETLIRGLGGRLTLDETEADESVLVIDLPASA